jgi:uncharacterized damage-inducible protein DinB
MIPAITADELLTWIERETAAYAKWFGGRSPDLLTLPTGPATGSGTIRDLLLHLYTVDLRYAERLVGRPVSDHAAVAAGATDLDGLVALARRGQNLLREAIHQPGVDWAEELTFVTRSAGTLVASRRKVLAHTLTHHIRHSGQLAMALRQHGHPTDWMHDLLLCDALH